nr:hypothetical protein [Bacillaceae bacterium]
GRKTDRQTSCAEKEWGVPVSPYSACGRPVLFFAKGASFPSFLFLKVDSDRAKDRGRCRFVST